MVLKVEVPPDLMAGDVEEGYGKVADVFAATWAAVRRSEPQSPSTATVSRLSISGVGSATGLRRRRGRKTPWP